MKIVRKEEKGVVTMGSDDEGWEMIWDGWMRR